MAKSRASYFTSGENNEKSKKHETISIFWLPIFVLPWFIFYILTALTYRTLPTPNLIENEMQNPHSFIGERAKLLNDELTVIGPRVVGSIENEVFAIQFFKREIEKIIASRNPIHDIVYEIQSTSGSFELYSMASVYQDIQNVVVKFTPANITPSHCLLLNSHFDTVPISPGAGDAGTMIGVMLEVLRVLSIYPSIFENGIVFLFNGAEEVGLQGSHMFMTQHTWAKDIRAVLNLDGLGPGGRDLMFRATAKNSWLIKYYVEHVIHPTATVLLDDLFKMNLVPSDTDFYIFRKYGNIPGLDFITYRNGYAHHTQFDQAAKVTCGTYQNVGDNILSLTKAIANAEELGNPSILDDENPIYFDFLGWFMISYSIKVSIIINVLVSLACLVGIGLSMWSHVKTYGLSCSMVSIQFGFIIIVQCVSIILTIGVLVLLSVIYDACNRSMAYYSSPWTLLGIYGCPLMFFLGLGCALHLTFWKKKEIHTRLYVQMYLHAQSIFYVIFVLAATVVGLRTGFAVLITLIFYTFTLFINFFSKLQLKDVSWTLIHFVGQVFPFMFSAYYTMISIELFVPIQGRSGPVSNPDIVMAVISICCGVVMMGYLVPTFCLFKKPLLVVSGFVIVFVCFIILIATPIGFPFRETDSPQRFWIFDTQRTFHNLDGTIRKADNGYFMLTMDRHMHDYVKSVVPGLDLAKLTEEECDTELFCGMPLYTTRMISQSKKSFWLPHTSPLNQNWPVYTEMRLLSKDVMPTNVQRLNFQISGPDHMALFVSPKLGNKIIAWNILNYVPNDVPTWGDRLTYFVFLGHGGANRPLEFFIEMEISNSTDGVVDIAAVGHYTHYDGLQTDEFREFMSSFPNWTQITPWMCTFESWVY